MPEGSSSAAPVIRPGPKPLKNPRERLGTTGCFRCFGWVCPAIRKLEYGGTPAATSHPVPVEQCPRVRRRLAPTMGSLSVACCSSFDAPWREHSCGNRTVKTRRRSSNPDARHGEKPVRCTTHESHFFHGWATPLRRSSTSVLRAILGPSASPLAVAAHLRAAFPLAGLNCSVGP